MGRKEAGFLPENSLPKVPCRLLSQILISVRRTDVMRRWNSKNEPHADSKTRQMGFSLFSRRVDVTYFRGILWISKNCSREDTISYGQSAIAGVSSGFRCSSIALWNPSPLKGCVVDKERTLKGGRCFQLPNRDDEVATILFFRDVRTFPHFSLPTKTVWLMSPIR